MPVERRKQVSFIPSRYYLDSETIDEITRFSLLECLKEYTIDWERESCQDFEKVYESFDFLAVLNLLRWLNMGNTDTEYVKLQEWWDSINNG
jgi:hypothetical protein